MSSDAPRAGSGTSSGAETGLTHPGAETGLTQSTPPGSVSGTSRALTAPDPAEQALVDAKRAKKKAARPVRIPDPQSPDEFFIMFGDICAAERKEIEAVKEMRRIADTDRDALLSLPYLYVKSDEELEFVREISLGRGPGRFLGHLYLGPNVSEGARDMYAAEFPLADITVDVAPLTTFQ